MPTKNTITHLFVSRCALLPYSFASYLGHHSSCIVALYDIAYQQSSIQYPRITLCTLAKNTSITCISFIYLSWTIPVFSFSTKYFCRSYLAFPLLLEESIDINSGVNHLTHSPKDFQSNTNSLGFCTLKWIAIII